MRDDNEAIFTTKFPMYCVRCVGERFILVAGGGGQAKTGVPNCIEVYLFDVNAGSWGFRKVAVVDTGLEATMNMDILTVDAKTGSFYVACGQEGKCAIYETSCDVTTLALDATSPVEQRSHSSDDPKITKKLSLSFRPFGEPFQTDFPSQSVADKKRSTGGPFQKTVRFSSNGDWLATGGTDGFVRIWNRTVRSADPADPMTSAPCYKLIGEHRAHQDDVDDVDINPDGGRFVSVGRDGTGSVWARRNANDRGGYGASEKSAFKKRDSGSGSGFSHDPASTNNLQSPFAKFIDLADPKYDALPAKYRFRFSRFFHSRSSDPDRDHLITVSIPVIRTASKKPCCYAIRWLITSKSGTPVERAALELRGEVVSALAVRSDGDCVAVGTLGGSVAVLDSRTLRITRFVPAAHGIFVTSLDFVPPGARRDPGSAFCPLLARFDPSGPLMNDYSTTPSVVISVSADNTAKMHVFPHDDKTSKRSNRKNPFTGWTLLRTLLIWLLIYYLLIFLGF